MIVLTKRFLSSTLWPFFLGPPLLKPNSRKKGTLVMKGLLRNLDYKGDQNPVLIIKATTWLDY